MHEMVVQSLGWEDPLQKEMVIHPSILTWKIPWTEEADGRQSMRLQKEKDSPELAWCAGDSVRHWPAGPQG